MDKKKPFIKNDKKKIFINFLKAHAKKNLCFWAYVRRYSAFEITQNKTYGSVSFGKYIKLFMKKFIFTKIFAMKSFVIFI